MAAKPTLSPDTAALFMGAHIAHSTGPSHRIASASIPLTAIAAGIVLLGMILALI